MEQPLTSFSKQYRTSSGNDEIFIPQTLKGSVYDICNIIIVANNYLLVEIWQSNGAFSSERIDTRASLLYALAASMAATH